MRRLIAEVHRRSLWQVLGVYLLASWVGYQVVLALTEGVGLPGWVPAFAIVLFVIGLPIVLATAIVQAGHPLQPDDDRPSTQLEGLVSAGDVLAGERRPDAPNTDRGASQPTKIAGILTWNRAIKGGVLAFALLGLAATGFLGMRALGIGPGATLASAGELDSRDPLVVADFATLGGDSMLAAVVSEGLRTDLAQSAFVTVADRNAIRQTLDRMMRPSNVPLDAATAREVALRMGLKAVIEGEVGRAGTGYMLTARVVTADSGRTLATFRETARDSTAIIDAIEALSHGLREKAGESLRTVNRSAPLADVTTSSLPALRLAVEAYQEERAGNRPRAMRLMTEAVTLDPGFAWAWTGLAIFHYNNTRRAEALAAIGRALENESRLDDRLRIRVRSLHAAIVGDHEAGIRETRELLRRDSTLGSNWANLSDRLWNNGDWDEAAATAARAVQLDSASLVANWNLIVALVDGGRLAEARQAVEAMDTATGGAVQSRTLRATVLAQHARYDSVHAQGSETAPLMAAADRVLGRWEESKRHLHDVQRDRMAALLAAVDEVVVLGRVEASDRIRAMLDSLFASDNPPPESYIAQASTTLAMAGNASAALAVRAEYEKRVPEPARWAEVPWLSAVDAFNALHARRGDEALQLLHRAREGTAWKAPVDALLARAFDLLGQADSAIAAYTRYIETPWSNRSRPAVLNDATFLVPAHERLAALYEQKGDMKAAARHAAAVVNLWKNADPVLQPRVAAAQRILQRATREGS